MSVAEIRLAGDGPRYGQNEVTYGLRTGNVRIEMLREGQGVILLPWQACGSTRERFLGSEVKRLR